MTKKLVSLSLFIFWAVVVAILTAGLVFYDRNKTNTATTSGTTSAVSSVTSTLSAGQTLTLSNSEVAKHSSASSCWLLINNNVYDVTNYMNQHPAGAGVILAYCGKDSTSAYNTKNIGRPHSSFADQLLANYLLGALNSTLTGQAATNATTNTAPAPTTTTTPTRGNDD